MVILISIDEFLEISELLKMKGITLFSNYMLGLIRQNFVLPNGSVEKKDRYNTADIISNHYLRFCRLRLQECLHHTYRYCLLQ